MSLQQALQAAMRARGIRVADLLERMQQRDRSTVYRLLSGDTRDAKMSTLLAACTAIGVTPNDLLDADAGSNQLQNFPELVVATTAAIGRGKNKEDPTTLQGTLNSLPNTTFVLDFYSNQSCDSSGFGEGQTFLGSTSVATDGGGHANINVTFAVDVAAGNVATATATDSNGNTSEFSQCVTVGGGGGGKPSAPVLNSPQNAGKVGTKQVPLAWNAVSGANSYSVFVRQDSTSGAHVFTQRNLTTTQTTTGALTPGKTYYWRVKACNNFGCTKSAWWSFKVKTGATFHLLGDGRWIALTTGLGVRF